MRKWMLVVLFCSSLGAGGCASKEMVKKAEPMAPSAGVSTPIPAPPGAAEPGTRVEVVPPEPPIAPPSVSESGSRLEAPGMTETPAREAAIQQESREAQKDATLESGLQRIYFDYDSAALSETARETLARNAELLTRRGDTIQIEGHTDERGSDEYNLALGERRARSALEYLVTLGVPAERLSTISYGSEKPVDPGHSEEAWAKNRRDEFVILR